MEPLDSLMLRLRTATNDELRALAARQENTWVAKQALREIEQRAIFRDRVFASLRARSAAKTLDSVE